jgi:hypothetical protein
MIGAKGLFGKSMMPGQMQPAYSMPQDMAAQDGANLGMASPQKRGGGFFGQGGAGRAIAGSIGDALLQQSGMAPIYAPQMQFQQAMAARQAEAERQRAASLEDYRTKLGIEAEFAQPEGPKPGSFEWYSDPNRTAQERAMYDQYNPVIASTWQGPVPVSRSSLGGGLPTAPVGRLTPIQPTIENTAPPQLNANGMPAQLTRDQYAAVVQRMGQAETEAWARRNNIRVVN